MILRSLHGTTFLLLALLLPSMARAARPDRNAADAMTQLAAYNVVWNEPGQGAVDSMPLGNGEVALNVWTEQNGDLLFYIARTDAWSEQPMANIGLMKLGLVRISLSPSQMASEKHFQQTLRLGEAVIEVQEGTAKFRVWVDANRPVIHVEMQSGQPVRMKAAVEPWYNPAKENISPVVFAPRKEDSVAWLHHDGRGSDPGVLNWTFGAFLRGPGMKSVDNTSLETAAAVRSQVLSIDTASGAFANAADWFPVAERQAAQTDGVPLDAAFREHSRWWDDFWHRSWIFVHGKDDATAVTRGYLLQRFTTACAGRGSYPVKFNGSLFVVESPAEGNPVHSVSANSRAWGGQYWFQNTRPMYWPRLMAGDFDEMLPLFRMYAQEIRQNAPRMREYYGHGGSYLAETAAFYAPVQNLKLKPVGKFTDYYFTPVLELSMMMLDYYDYTGDKAFVKDTLLPVAAAGADFFDQHFPHGTDGKLLFDPDNAIETYWMARNPAPDIAGLRAVLPRLLQLPGDLVDAKTRADLQRILAEVPELPEGSPHGVKVLLPYEGEQTMHASNGENPELYAVYPFRLYGLGRPDLELALNTWKVRRNRGAGCWLQDPVEAPLLGLTDEARKDVTFNLTRKDPRLKFPAFWERGHDYMPDEDNGGNGENSLQLMLMQNVGGKILLIPAWPKDWNADFKLNAPGRTTVEGRVINGKVTGLKVTPASRAADVEVADGIAALQ